jgi:MoaA/NifB/PqqE/SkfB family radical SAM enzyme
VERDSNDPNGFDAPAGGPIQTFLLEGNGMLVLETGRMWLLSEERWMELDGVLADELVAVLAGGEPGARLAALSRSGIPGADRLTELARAPRREVTAGMLTVERPSILFVELTDKCPLDCLHCYAEASLDGSSSMSADLAANLVDQAAEIGFGRLQLTGGEPLLHPELASLVSRAVDAGIDRVEVFTSGVGLDPVLLGAISDQAEFAISVYSTDPAVHDRITGVPGSLAATLAAIDLLLERGFQLRVAVILMRENAGDWPRTRAELVERGVPAERVSASLMSRTGRGREAELPDELPDDLVADPADPEPSRDPWSWPGKAAVSPSGDVFPCIFARWLKLGNAAEQSLSEILARPDACAAPELPVPERWRYCCERLSCPDCRMLAFGLMGRGR